MMNLSWANDGIPVSYKIGNVNIREVFGVELTNMPSAALPDVRERTTQPSHTHGEFDAGSVYGSRRFTINGRIMGTTQATCMAQWNAFLAFIQLEDNLQQFTFRGRTISGVRLEASGHEYAEPRVLVCTYNGGGTISPISRAHFKGRAYDFTLPLKAAYPFWVSKEYSDTHRNNSDHQWLRVPKTGTGGTAQTYPELQFDGPIGSTAVTVAHGLFCMNLRFRNATYTASGNGIIVPETNIYGVTTNGVFTNGVSLTAVASTETVGVGRSVGLFGAPSGAHGSLVKVALRRSVSYPTSADTPHEDQAAINSLTGTFSCFLRPSFDINDGDSGDERTHTLMAIGETGTGNQLHLRFRYISDKMRVELATSNDSSTEYTESNPS